MADARRYHVESLSITDEGLALIRRHEGFEPHWYRDSAGVPTIGYGTTSRALPDVTPSTLPGPIKRMEALQLVMRALHERFAPRIEQLVDVRLSFNEYSALCSITYNIGWGALSRSTLLRKINAGDYGGAAHEFDRWVYAESADTGEMEVLPGLVRRRTAEKALWNEKPAAALEVEPMPTRGLRPEPLPITQHEMSDMTEELPEDVVNA